MRLSLLQMHGRPTGTGAYRDCLMHLPDQDRIALIASSRPDQLIQPLTRRLVTSLGRAVRSNAGCSSPFIDGPIVSLQP